MVGAVLRAGSAARGMQATSTMEPPEAEPEQDPRWAPTIDELLAWAAIVRAEARETIRQFYEILADRRATRAQFLPRRDRS
jgi:hypothetical protein